MKTFYWLKSSVKNINSDDIWRDQGFYTLLSFEVLCLALFLESPVVCVVEKPWLQRDILLVSQL